ncbi:serine-type D-Ala-D-Ala carboxypeptidase [Firmicutes bacterium CAG:884]|nr:serine-type D-Ala-D-Ala carboxypeptidase [Firmicutes bacterium CAG:884]
MKKIIIIFTGILLCISKVNADEIFAPSSKSAILIEASTGEVLYEKNANEKLKPASMTKMMTLLLTFEAIERGDLKLTDEVIVSINASGMGGSQILLETGEKMTVDNLIKGVAIASGNDAAVALAEKIGGTEDYFVELMNKRATELGLKNTHFQNAHGIDAENHYSTAYDMSVIARELLKHEKITDYTKIYEMYLRENTNRKVWLVNTNKLVRFYDYIDGLKTGYTRGAGYCITLTGMKNGMRLIAVTMDEPSIESRNRETLGLIDYGFAQYELETLLSKESIIATKTIAKSIQRKVDVVPLEDIKVLNKKMQNKKTVTYKIDINNIEAPVNKGNVVGSITLIENDKETRTIPLTVKESIKKANIFELYLRNMKELLLGQI